MSNKEFHNQFRRRPRRLAFVHAWSSFRDGTGPLASVVVVAFLFVWLWKTASLHTSLQNELHESLPTDPQHATPILLLEQTTRNNNNNNNNHAVPLSPWLWSPQRPSEQVVKRDKQGKVVHRSITELKADPSAFTTNNNNNSNSLQDAARGREPLLELLHDAGVTTLEAAAVAQLPPWSDIASMYYTDAATGRDQSDAGPVIIGLDTCAAFRHASMARHHDNNKEETKEDASIGVAGLFNTGTNPLAMYLSANCRMPQNNNHNKNHGMRWQVPWGKHMMAARKWNNTARHDEHVNKAHVLPVVLIRDVYTWARSMCQHPYAAQWNHSQTHCPNLVGVGGVAAAADAEEGSLEKKTVPVTIAYPGQAAVWDSLVHLWSDWYHQYLNADYPRLIVRFEDLIFRPKQVINEVCTCAGAVPATADQGFQYVVDAGKWGSAHQHSSNNMITAMQKYGSAPHRLDGWNSADRTFARQHEDTQKLLQLFQYALDNDDDDGSEPHSRRQ